jgi:hypothetical protein
MVLTLCIQFVNSILAIAATPLYFCLQIKIKPVLNHNSVLQLKRHLPQSSDLSRSIKPRPERIRQISLLHSRMQPDKLRGKGDTTKMLPFPTNDSTVNVLAIRSDYR